MSPPICWRDLDFPLVAVSRNEIILLCLAHPMKMNRVLFQPPEDKFKLLKAVSEKRNQEPLTKEKLCHVEPFRYTAIIQQLQSDLHSLKEELRAANTQRRQTEEKFSGELEQLQEHFSPVKGQASPSKHPCTD